MMLCSDLTNCHVNKPLFIWSLSLSLVLIGEDDSTSDVHVTTLLHHIFNAMVLLCGLDDTTNIKHVERFKREIKVSYILQLAWLQINIEK